MAKGKVALGALFGAVAGFVTGILVAPKSGKETRQDIKEAAGKAKDTAVEKAGEAKEFAEEKTKEMTAKAKQVSKDVSDKAVELKDRTEQAVEGAKKGCAKKPKSAKK